MNDEHHFVTSGISRRSMLREGVACVAGVATIFAISTNAALASKLPQKAVAYQTKPKGDNKCSACALFEPPNACKSVDGVISPDGWCLLWRKS